MVIHIVPAIIYSSMMGITLFTLLGLSAREQNRQTRYLFGLQLLLLAHIVGELFIFSGAYRFAPALAGAQFPIRMLLGPALYFYALACMSPAKKQPKKVWLAALSGPALVILGMLPFILGMSAEEKLALANPATRDPELFKIAVYTCLFAMTAFGLYTAAYLIAAFRLQQRHRKQLLERFSDIDKRAMNWFKTLLFLWGLTWCLFIVDFGINFIGIKWFGTGILLPLFEAIVLMAFNHYALQQPPLNDEDKGKAKEKEKAVRVASLDQISMAQIADALTLVMQNDKLYLKEDLSLRNLSEIVGVSENYISETLSQYLTTNFFQFINGYRIDHAKSLLMNTDQNIGDIAFAVGFNSKSTFNAAFKKTTGKTPSAFRNGAKGTLKQQA